MNKATGLKDKNIEIFEEGNRYLMNTYARLPVVFTRAKMQYLWDANGKKYTDFIAGYGCLNVGHGNKYVVSSLKNQIKNITQPSNLYYSSPQVELAKKLCDITGFGQKVFFANSGTEAIEAAVKLARKYSKEKYSSGRFKIISFFKSFHGRTLGALSATAQEEKQKIFEPLVEGFDYAHMNDMDSVKKKVDEDTCAILIEPVQGEGGVNIADHDFLKELRKLCTDKKMLLILDEVQTGFGRTGKMFAYQHYAFYPDILVLAKSIGGGMPLGAIVSNDEVSSVFMPGSHGSTFGGNAASCAAGCAVIDYILNNSLEKRASELGKYFEKALKKLQDRYDIVKEIRSMGLMIGVELKKPIASEIVMEALKDNLVINKVSDHVLRFLPTLVITRADIDKLIRWMHRKLGAFQQEV